MNKPPLSLGKLPNQLLQELLQTLPAPTNEMILPPAIGCDAAGLTIGGQLVAVTTDPITFTSDRIAKYCIAVNINDIACLGCEPRWFTSNLLLPPGTTEQQVRDIWHELVVELNRYQIQAIGGHIEVTASVKQPIMIGQMMGYALRDKLWAARDAKAGDSILLWQPIAIEGTAIIARARYTNLISKFGEKYLQELISWLDSPGICLWPFAKSLVDIPGIVALHDPTEGGLATALHELADAAGTGLKILREKIPIFSQTEEIAQYFNIDPLGLLASGSLLIVCEATVDQTILQKLSGEPIAKIGQLTIDKQRMLCYKNSSSLLPRYEKDELVKVL